MRQPGVGVVTAVAVDVAAAALHVAVTTRMVVVVVLYSLLPSSNMYRRLLLEIKV